MTLLPTPELLLYNIANMFIFLGSKKFKKFLKINCYLFQGKILIAKFFTS